MLNFRTFDLNLLRVLDAVMSEGSLTRAAAALAMTQPAVSHAVQRLRVALGDELFVRTARGVKPTPVAQALWPQVRDALAGLRQSLAPEQFDPALDAAELRIAMADATAAMLAPGLVQCLETQAPLVRLRVLPLTMRDPRPLVDSGDADLAVGFFPDAVAAIVAQGRDSHLRHARLYDTQYVCVMRSDHALAGATLTLNVYCAAPHLLVSFSGRSHGYVDQALAAIGRQRRVVLTVNQYFTAARVVAHSDLLTVMPDGFVAATGYAGQLHACALPLALGPVNIAMVWHLRHDATPAQRWLRARVQAVVVAEATAAAQRGVGASQL